MLFLAVRKLRLALLAVCGSMPSPEPRYVRTQRPFVLNHYAELVAVLRGHVDAAELDHEPAWRLCHSIGDGSLCGTALYAVVHQLEQRRRRHHQPPDNYRSTDQ